eukprot:TRINITY_DN6285_c0_g1_i1.p1 TRINITY_DN6285_c0_g1~~TRINITY_DN6285_c0_g1_i1.p1  ORF type:complete len:141 (+),score=22.37 TRINITY_DN6285_c0_g1_i1:163-585(+)
MHFINCILCSIEISQIHNSSLYSIHYHLAHRTTSIMVPATQPATPANQAADAVPVTAVVQEKKLTGFRALPTWQQAGAAALLGAAALGAFKFGPRMFRAARTAVHKKKADGGATGKATEVSASVGETKVASGAKAAEAGK